MMKVVCVVQPYYRLHGSHNNRMEMGLHYLAEVLLRSGVSASVYNGDYEAGDVYADWPSIRANAWYATKAYENGHPMFAEVAQSVAQLEPTHVVIGAGATVTPTLNNGSVRGAELIAIELKKLLPNVKVIGYGPQFTFAERIPDVIDCALKGEGDHVIVDLVMKRGPLPREVAPSLLPAENMNDLPFLEASTLDPRTPCVPHDMDYISGSRGCLFKCHYCLVPTFQGRTRYMSPTRYVAEMEHRRKVYGVKGLYLCDQTFTENRKRLVEMCELMRDRLPDQKWWAEARIETLRPETYGLMAESGCKSLKIGIEAGDPQMLEWFGKKTDLEKARTKIEALKDVGISPTIYVLLGTPGATRENYERSYEFMKSLNAPYYVVNITTAARGTKMFDKVKPDLEAAGLYAEGQEEGFGHVSDEMKRFWGLDDDIVDRFYDLVDGDKKEDAGLRRYVRRLL